MIIAHPNLHNVEPVAPEDLGMVKSHVRQRIQPQGCVQQPLVVLQRRRRQFHAREVVLVLRCWKEDVASVRGDRTARSDTVATIT